MKKKNRQIIEYERAVIYPRVSSPKQVHEGHGIDSQSHRCEKYALDLGLKIADKFSDEGISGALLERPGMRRLLEFLDDNPDEKFIVVIDDISRLARDLKVYLELKLELAKRGAKIKSPNFNFEETPEGEFIENVLAAKAQLDRGQNNRQVKQKMKARLEAGFYTFCPPPGLKNKRDPVKGKILMNDEPYASIYKEAIEKFLHFELNTYQAVREFILSQYAAHNIKKPLSVNGTYRILTNLLYAGYLEYKPWGVERRKAQHDGFISYETHLAVIDKIEGKAKPRLRKDYNEDFPLRGFVMCCECNESMTAFWSKGNGGKYPYYKCKTDGCIRKNKSIPGEVLEGCFKNLLAKVKPRSEVLSYLEAVLKDSWEQREKQESQNKKSIRVAISNLESKNDVLMERITETNNKTVISKYEEAISHNLEETQKLKNKLSKIKYSQQEFQTALGVVSKFINNPIEQWESKDYKRQLLLLNMYFNKKIIYYQDSGFQTIQLPLILELSAQQNMRKSYLVEMAGVKPASKTHFSQSYSQD